MSRGKPSGWCFAFPPFGVALVWCALMLAPSAMAGTTWDGGGANASWGTANNWTGNALPVFDGTETITLNGNLPSGTTLTLDGNRYIDALTITTTTGFTIATGTGGTLNLRSGNITRQDVGGTEAVQIISAGMVLGDPTAVVAYTGTWNIAGSNSLNITGSIGETGGSRGINKTGIGTVILSGTNSFSGGLTLSAGTVSISSDANLGASSGQLTFNGGTLQVTGNVSGTRALTMTGAGAVNVGLGSIMQESGLVSGNGALSLTGYGTLILSGSGSNGTGATTIGGVLSLRGTVALGSGNLAFNTGILELGNTNFTRALGTGANQVNMNSAAGFAAYGADRTVNLGGSGATVIWGSGNFVASGSAFYFGSTMADHTLDFQNGINLNSAVRSIQTLRGVGSGPEGKISGLISGTGISGLSFDAVSGYSAGSIILSNGSNSYAGTTTVTAGNLLLEANATGTAGNTVLGSGSSDILIGNTSGAYNAGLFTNGSVTISRNIRAQSGNTGVISLGGYSATTSTFSGNIFLGTTSGTGKGVTLTAAAGGTTTFSGIIQDPTGVSGPGLVRKDGIGTVVLSGVNTYAGGTSIDSGTLSISQSANLGANSGGVALNAGTLEISAGFSTNRIFTLGSTNSTFQIDPSQTFTVTSVIGGSGALNKSGTGTMVLSGANSYSGATNVTAGTLQLSANDRVANASNLTVCGGTFDLQTYTETVGTVTLSSGSITGTGTGRLTGSSFTLESGSASAILAGTGVNMTKNTSGTVTLTGVNTFTGTTTVNAGTVTLTGGPGGALGATSGITVNSGGTLLLGAANQINNSATMTLAGGTFARATFNEGSTSGAGVGALTLTAVGSHLDFGTGAVGTLAFASFNPGANTLTVDNWTGAPASQGGSFTDRLIFTSDQSANLSSFNFTGYASGGYQFDLGGGFYEITPAAVPEPATCFAAALAFAAAAFHQRARIRGLFPRGKRSK